MSQTKAQLLEGKTDQDVNAKTIALAGATSGTATISATAIAGTPTLTLPSVSGTIDRLNRAGNILQVVQTVKDNVFSSAGSTGWIDVTGFSASITPSSASNKVLVTADIFMGLSDFYNFNYYWRFVRGSTAIGVGTGGGTNITGGNNLHISGGSVPFLGGNTKTYLDSPATTSSVAYKVQISNLDVNGTLYVNRRGANTDAVGISTITLMEVAA